MAKLTHNIDYSGNDPIYEGWALPGTKNATAMWKIKKLIYSGGLIVAEQWAGADNKFDKIWDNRATYSYF